LADKCGEGMEIARSPAVGPLECDYDYSGGAPNTMGYNYLCTGVAHNATAV